MWVARVNKHCSDKGIEFSFVSLEGADVEAHRLHLGRQLKEERVSSGRKDDMHDNEDNYTETEEEWGEGDKFEMRAYSIVKKPQEGIVSFPDVSSSNEGYLDAHI